ncbi:HAD hydrolase [Dendrothele bispora CBS 962.96]|uniref:HAD hydrolase n=1 Tax=Dendrothele bispora (strain CBS 962.96) TaxID=1314807 RepID=A0A4S8MU09_DENBC|nr:HAD hydrolase [Dendrothele bispora CBS 962.96]
MLRIRSNIIPARRSLSSAFQTLRNIQTNVPTTRPPLAFAFDIDGVLMTGPNAVPVANKALRILEGNNPFKTKIPYILLTNGGGSTEQARSAKLSKQLGIEITPRQVIQAHTILKDSVGKYADLPVLVLGGKGTELREVAHSYGFRKVFTSLDILASNPSIQPFVSLASIDTSSTVPIDLSTTPISAVFVFHDPRNWFNDVQVVLDVIQSGGVIGGPYIESSNPIEVIFCNPDLIWKSEFPQPRLGQGAFREAFQAVYKALNGSTYPHVVQYGKPTAATYNFAEKVLTSMLQELYGPADSSPTVYMIGDNPESDIAGANAAGWSSVLVHTGVFDPKKGPPKHTPTHQATDVEQAVIWAIQREAVVRGRQSSR